MTAVAGILNKQGVAIAADSAVTVSGFQGRKVYNSANKIFTLSKYHPVGIAIYNSAQFMGIPWEIIIKEYRKQLGKGKFSKLAEYKQDFFVFLKTKNYFLDDSSDEFLYNDLLSFLQAVLNETQLQVGVNNKIEENNILKFLDHYIKSDIPNYETIESLTDLKLEKVREILEPFLPKLISLLEQNINSKLKQENCETLIIEAYFAYLTHNQFLQFTGLIFTGYGEDELFPRMYPVNVSIVIDGNLRYIEDLVNVAEVNNRNFSFIRPFAQTDVINTILKGISPELNTLSTNVFGEFITSFLGELKSMPGMPETVQRNLDSLNIANYIAQYQRKFDNIVDERYVFPLMGAVAQLSKEDLAEMAESLVYLTYLKRRFTMAEESVGGPVDIAVITKGDGFIWIKRKHYFDPELNRSYFNKYL